jgi:hypothetical protein
MFSFKRFTQEFHSTLLFNAKRHGTFLLIFILWIILKHFLFFKIGGYNSNPDDLTAPEFLFIIMVIATSVDVFSRLRGPISGSQYLMTPSNTGEKFASAWLYSTLFTFAIVTISYNLTHLICMIAINALNGSDFPIDIQTGASLWAIFRWALLFQAIYFLGAVTFRKNPAAKTTVALFGVIIAGGIFGSFVISQYLGNPVHFNGNLHMRSSNDWKQIFGGEDLPQVIENIEYTIKMLLYITPFACWIGSYFILKNKQV